MKKAFAITAGDAVWMMHENRAVCATVVKVGFRKFISCVDYKTVVESELYTLSLDGKPVSGLHEKKDLFPSKADLIKSL